MKGFRVRGGARWGNEDGNGWDGVGGWVEGRGGGDRDLSVGGLLCAGVGVLKVQVLDLGDASSRSG